MRRVHVPAGTLAAQSGAEVVELPVAASHYVVDVLRLGAGDPIEVFDGTGDVVRGVLVGDGRPATVRVEESGTETAAESGTRIVLNHGIPKGNRWELVIEKATELGVDTIVALETARTVVRIDEKKVERKLDRWRRVAATAARQCDRTVVPEIAGPASVSDAVSSSTGDGLGLVLHPAAAGEDGLPGVDAAGVPLVELWVGPEGGFEDDELELISTVARPVRLGPRVLRSETAGVVAVALAQYLYGDLAADSG